MFGCLFGISILSWDHGFPKVKESDRDRKGNGGMEALDILFDHLSGAPVTAEKMKRSGIDEFLFDLRRAQNQVSLTSQWWAIKNLMTELGFKPHSKYALLVTPELLADYDFVETVLINAGYHSKRFINESEAVKWLEE